VTRVLTGVATGARRIASDDRVVPVL